MKVVHISDYPLSLAPYRLSLVQKEGGIDARLINYSDRYPSGLPFLHDVLVQESLDLATQLLEDADVIHYHDAWKNGLVFQNYPHLWEVVKNKPSAIQFHSFRWPHFEESLQEPSLTKLVIAQCQARFYPECTPVPNAVPIYDEFHQPTWTENEVPVIGFTPSNCEDKRPWTYKGCAETMDVLKDKYQYKFATQVPWKEAMATRSSCDIAIDEIITGSYHMCSLEALSQGLATIANLDELCIDALEKVTGSRKHPWIIASPDTLESKLNHLIEDKAFLKSKRQESRKYMEKYWDPQALADRFRNIYEQI